MSAKTESDILIDTWDRPELLAEQEIKPEFLVAPEQLELSRPIEATLELLRRNRIEAKDTDEDETKKKQIWPTSYYLIRDENHDPRLFEASLTESSQQESLTALCNTEDFELRRMLLDQLNLQPPITDIWQQSDPKLIAASLGEHGVALIAEPEESDRSMSVLVLGDNGRDVSKLEIPHISFSNDEVVETKNQPAFTPVDKVEVSDTETTVGKKYVTAMQLVKTEIGFQFYINGQPHPGIRQDDPSIQYAIEQLLLTGFAQDSIEEKGYLTEMEYTCNGDPNTLEIGGSLDVTLMSESNPIEKKEVEIVSDDDIDEEYFAPIDDNQTDYETLPLVTATEVPNNDSSIFEDWFSAPEWTAEIKSDQEAIDDVLYPTHYENYIIPNRENNSTDELSIKSQLESQKEVVMSLEFKYLAPTKQPASDSYRDQENQPTIKTIDSALPIFDQPEKQSQPKILTNPSEAFSVVDNPDNLLPLFAISKTTNEITNTQPVIYEDHALQSANHISPNVLTGQENNEQPIPALTRHSKDPKPRDPNVMKLILPTTDKKQHSAHLSSTKEEVEVHEFMKVELQKSTQTNSTQQSQHITSVARIIRNVADEATSKHNTVKTTIASKGKNIEVTKQHTLKQALQATVTVNQPQIRIEPANRKTEHLIITTANSQKAATIKGNHQRQIIVAQDTKTKTTHTNRSSAKSRMQDGKHQAIALPTGDAETARSVITTALERLRKQSEFEGRDPQLSLSNHGNTRILPEQIYQLDLLTNKIAELAKRLSIQVLIAIDANYIAFTPLATDPIERAKIMNLLALPPYSLTIQPDLSATYLLRTAK